MDRSNKLKPFVKWAGGKSQLVPEIADRLPDMSTIETYVEPFVGGGAMLFYILENCPHIKCVINDINKDLINLYQMVKFSPVHFISDLKELEVAYNWLPSDKERERFYYDLREFYNSESFYNYELTMQAAVFLALNKLGFNGLYRLNKVGEFNVPWGKRKELNICNQEWIYKSSRALANVRIMCGDYSMTEIYASAKVLFYLDPPYKPLDTKKSKLNQYTSSGFNDAQQEKLKRFCDKIGDKGSKLILSDSDTSDGYFNRLYGNGDVYKIDKVEARRAINCKGDKRGKISELIITNY